MAGRLDSFYAVLVTHAVGHNQFNIPMAVIRNRLFTLFVRNSDKARH